jgi:hypothetical protein
MTSYTVVWRIDVDDQSPRDAAKQAADTLSDYPTDEWEYEVTDDETGEVIKIDLSISDEDYEDDEEAEYERTLKRCSD